MSSAQEQSESPSELLARFVRADEARFRGDHNWKRHSLAGLSPVDHEKLADMLECINHLAESGQRIDPTQIADSANTDPSNVVCREVAEDELPYSTYAGYDVKRLLGSGGFGLVYEGWNHSLNRKVAIKIPRPGVLANQSLRERFQREARASAALEHPNIVRVYATFSDEQPAIVYEYCDGLTLDEFVTQNPGQLTETSIVDIATGIAAALRHAHSRGVLHRDIKPDNVLLVKAKNEDLDGFELNGQWWVPKLCDFGLAKILDDDSNATRTDIIMGTINFMAPEQASGNVKSTGTHTDIFSFGSLLYWLVVGRTPFETESRITTLVQIESFEPTSLRSVRPEISKPLERVCRKCLQKLPERRYDSTATLVDDLHALRNGEPISIKPDGVLERGRVWIHNNRVAVATMMAILLVSAIGLGVEFWYNRSLQGLVDQLDSSNSQLESRISAEQDARRDALVQKNRAEDLYYSSSLAEAVRLIREARPERARERLKRFVPRSGEADLRDLAWRLLWAKSAPVETATLKAHSAPILSSAFSASLNLASTGDKTGNVLIWDMGTREQVSKLFPFPGEVCDLEFSVDGSLLAACGTGGVIRIHATDDWRIVKLIIAHGQTVKGLEFTPNGETLISCSRDDEIVFWNVETWKESRRFTAHDTVQVISLSADGRSLASGGDDGRARVWDVATGELRSDYKNHHDAVLCTALSDDGRFLAAGGYNHHVSVWNTTNDNLIQINLDQQIWSVRFISNNEILIGTKTEICYCDFSNPLQPIIRHVEMHEDKIRSFELLQESQVVMSVSDDTTIRLTSGLVRSPKMAEVRVPHAVRRIAFRPDGDRMAIATNDKGHVQIMNRRGKQLQIHTATENSPAWVAWPDGIPRVAGWDTNNVKVTTAPDAETQVQQLFPHNHSIRTLAFSPDGRRLVTSADDLKLRCWDIESAQLVDICSVDELPNMLQLSGDNHKLAWVQEGGKTFVRDLREKSEIELNSSGNNGLYAVAFDPTSRYVAAGGFDGLVTVWDLQSPATPKEIPVPAQVNAISFSNDGRLLAIGSNDLRLYKVSTGDLVFASGVARESPCECIAFSPNDDCIVSVHSTHGDESVVRIRDPTITAATSLNPSVP